MRELIDILRHNPILLILLGGWLLSLLGNVMTRAARRAQQPPVARPREPQPEPSVERPITQRTMTQRPMTQQTMTPESMRGERSPSSDLGPSMTSREPMRGAMMDRGPMQGATMPRMGDASTARSTPSVDVDAEREVAAQRLREMLRKMGMEPTTPEVVRVPAHLAERRRETEPEFEEYREPEHGVPGQLLEELARKELNRKVFTTDVERREVLATKLAADNVKQYFGHLPELDDANAASLRRRERRVLFDARNARAAVIAREVLGDPRGLRPWE